MAAVLKLSAIRDSYRAKLTAAEAKSSAGTTVEREDGLAAAAAEMDVITAQLAALPNEGGEFDVVKQELTEAAAHDKKAFEILLASFTLGRPTTDLQSQFDEAGRHHQVAMGADLTGTCA